MRGSVIAMVLAEQVLVVETSVAVVVAAAD
jgi:hypothetical protein